MTEDGNQSWIYRLDFRRTAHFGFFGLGWGRNQLRLVVPRDVPIRIVGSISTGESELDLGGLTLSYVALDLSAGHHDIAFRQPLSQPLESLDVEARGVELAIFGIGNASPRRVNIDQRAGKSILDFRGEWLTDSEIYTGCRVGELDVQLPEDVRLDVSGDLTSPATLGMTGAAAEVAAPRIRAHFDSRLCRERQRLR